jgi:metal-dependent amidase/aminoacylase/carboxypeptidase family protein
MADIAAELVGVDNVNREGGLVMGSEDFSFMLERRPGAYIAVRNGGTPFCHNPSYDFNDAILPLGAIPLR